MVQEHSGYDLIGEIKIDGATSSVGQVLKGQGDGNIPVWGYDDYGLSFQGTVTGIVAPPKFQCTGLIGFGDDFFKGYWSYVVWDDGGGGAAPQGEMLECTGYDSATGDFTVAAYTVAIAVGDKVLLIHPAIASLLNTTYGLSALKVLIDAIEAKVESTAVGRAQIAAATIDLDQGVGTYDLFTGDTEAVLLESLNIKLPTGAIGGTITGITIQTDDATPGVIIDAAAGAVANLLTEADIGWTGTLYITVGTKIRLTIITGPAGASYVCNVTAKCRAVVAGGNLA